jgi:hypothetical protein
MLEPTKRQRADLKEIQGSILLVQFLVNKDDDSFETFRAVSERAVVAAEGKRTHCVHIDQFLAGGEMPYQTITIDEFSTGTALQNAFDTVRVERQAALADIYALIVRPNNRMPRIVKTLGFLAPLVSRLLKTDREKDMTGFDDVADPETGPVPATVAEMRQHDQTTPFYMMNLNKYYAKAQYADGEDVSGEVAYNRYSGRIAPYLVSVRGYPSIFGDVLAAYVGDENSPLHDDWSDFAMVNYPSRKKFINMMSNTPSMGVHHRTAGLQRAVLMPSSDIYVR